MERRREIVLDSSVVVKWFSKETQTNEALKLRDAYLEGSIELTVTEMLISEVANALRYKPDFNAEKLNTALSGLFSLHMNIVHLNESIMSTASLIAFEGKITLYDALPVAIAQERKATCITADEETQYKKLCTKGYSVELL